ncbi:TRAP transporter small permease [Tropicimonas sp. IMCC34011]|uniref:TRAP transporter small permease n=1 Tax=Tropicimonas sp. IMCC34011 TaxID=2248759 RepID=UPI001E4A4D23|nr:TRAP transporter small permease [Tropicimonas sp. IMCC34011]
MGWITRGALALAAVSVAAIVVIGTWDTVGRILGHPLLGSVEMTESLLAATIFLALPFAQREYRHVVVDIVIQNLPKVTERPLNIIALVFTLGAFGLLFLQSYEGAHRAYAVGEVSSGSVRVPVWLAKIFASIGLLIATVETARQLVFTLFWPDLELRAIATDPETGTSESD